MADTITEFYSSDSINYSAVNAGLTVATTSGSEKAVIRDVNIEVPGSLPLDLSVDGIKVAETSGKACSLSGTLLLKESQTLKLTPTSQPLWTGIQTNFYGQDNTNSSVKRSFNDLAGSGYWTVPTYETRVKVNAREERYIRPGEQTVTALTNGNTVNNSAEITLWPADALFSKPTDDFYYSSYMDDSSEMAGYNKLCYYDASADTVSQVAAATSGYYGWESGFSNRYMVINKTDGSGYKYFDTTDNSLSAHINYTQANTGTTFTISRRNHTKFTSIIDHYMLEKPEMEGTHCKAYLTDILTGKTVYWQSENNNTNTTLFPGNGSSRSNWTAGAQLARNTYGEWFVLWNFTRSNTYSAGNHNYGLRVVSLGSDLSTYFSQATFEAPKGAVLTCAWLPLQSASMGDTRFRLHDGGNQRYGWGTGFCGLAKPTTTNYNARYWMHNMHDGSFLIDLDNAQADGEAFCSRIRWYEGTSNTDGLFSGYVENYTWCPTWYDSKISSTYGTMKARVTGIKET